MKSENVGAPPPHPTRQSGEAPAAPSALRSLKNRTYLITLYIFLAATLSNNRQDPFPAVEINRESSLTFKIERASLKSELEQIVDVINLAYQRQPFNRADRQRITLSQLNEILLNPNHTLFLLYSGEKICGTVLLSQSEISLFAIHPAFQGHGYGQQLLVAAEEEAFKAYDSVLLKVIPLFQEKLITYYESLGYCSQDEREALSKGKLDRIQECYHDEVYALILRKNRP